MSLDRLALVSASFELLDAAIEAPARLGHLLRAALADGWAGFPEALPLLRESYASSAQDSWGTFFFILEDPRTLVGLGGYKGAPTPEGVVEIGYAVAPAFQRRGLATEAARQLVARAFADACIAAVDAHTLGSPNPSTKVLLKLGMQRIGEQVDPEHGPIWQWRLRRPDITVVH